MANVGVQNWWAKVENEMRAHGIDVETFALRIGVSMREIRRWKRGDLLTMPETETLELIDRYFDKDLSGLRLVREKGKDCTITVQGAMSLVTVGGDRVTVKYPIGKGTAVAESFYRAAERGLFWDVQGLPGVVAKYKRLRVESIDTRKILGIAYRH